MFHVRRIDITLFLILSACATRRPEPQLASQQLAELPVALSAPQTPAALRRSEAPVQKTETKTKKVELNLSPKSSDLSKEWRLHPYELRKQTLALEQFVRYGRYPKAYCSGGRAKSASGKKLCEQIRLITSSYQKNSKPKPNKARQAGVSATGRTFRIGTHNLTWVQREHFDDVISSISSVSSRQIITWLPQILKNNSCPRNFSAAAIRKLENILPDNDAKLAIEKLYAHASTCLKPGDAGYSITHFRQALLRVLWGDQSRARIAANLAPLGARGEELPRTLFWAGLLQTDSAQRDQHWSRLMADHPLSFHALQAHKQLSRDPLADVIGRPLVAPSRESQTPELALSLKWFEALSLGGRDTAASRLAFWISSNYKDELNLGNLIYITHLKANHNTHQASFGFMWSQIEKNPENMNEQSLKLMFPLPYWEIFKRAGGPNDPMLLVSVARQESAFNPQAKSPANARGLLQLLPSTAHAMAGRHVNLFAPEINAHLGSKFLDKMIKKFGSVELALAAYNAGPQRVPQWRKRFPTKSSLLFIDLIPYRETRNYVSNILRNNYWYSRLYEEAPFRVPRQGTSHQSLIVSSLIKGTKDVKTPLSDLPQAR